MDFSKYDGDHTGKPLPSGGSRVRCKVCGDVIQSMHRHDFKWCKGGHVAVDGGNSYLKICGEPKDYEVLSDTPVP